MKYWACLLLLPMAAAHGAEIYLCKAYSGGMFWSSAPCSQQNAITDRIANVPDSLPWDQKVALGEQQRGAAAAVHAQSSVTTVVTSQPDAAVQTRAQCKALDARVEQLDDMARQPQSGPTHDWIRRERQSARDRQFALRC